MRINDNFEKLPESYLFSTVARKLREYKEKNPDVEVIRMDIGDVTLPLPAACVAAMHRAVDDMGAGSTFHGYGPEQGYAFLREAIAANDYEGLPVGADEIFVSDGAKSDLGNLGDIYSRDSIVAVTDPGYPVYVDSNVIDGRGGELVDGKWSRFVYLDCTPANGFKPTPPVAHADVIFLCSPANPTGAAFTRGELKAWVDYARDNKALIVFDSAYCAYVTDKDTARSIYEIEGAREVAIEVRSFSKTAGFTGLRCGYTVVPDTLVGYDAEQREVPLRKLWLRRQTTKFNGASYVIQRGAEATYFPGGKGAGQGKCGLLPQQCRYHPRHSPQGRVRGIRRRRLALCVGEIPWRGRQLGALRHASRKGAHKLHTRCGLRQSRPGVYPVLGFNTLEKTREAMRRLEDVISK